MVMWHALHCGKVNWDAMYKDKSIFSCDNQKIIILVLYGMGSCVKKRSYFLNMNFVAYNLVSVSFSVYLIFLKFFHYNLISKGKIPFSLFYNGDNNVGNCYASCCCLYLCSESLLNVQVCSLVLWKFK